MPDIFLSYNRNDQPVARRFAEGFEREGFSVWWDQTLRSGEAYDKVTEKALEDSKAVVVLWSKASVDSRWVRAEATQADRNGTLVPVMIEACKRPIMFELTHTAELGKWKGDAGDPAWQAFVADVRQFVHKDPSVAQAARPVAVPKRRFNNLQIAIAVVALAIVGVGAWWALNRSGLPGLGASATAAARKGAVTLAVVPFANPDGGEASRVLAFGVAESVQHQLGKLGDLSVISWSSASGIDHESQDIREIAKMLGVAYVVTGSVQSQGDVLRVTARLVEAATEKLVWSLREERKQKDVFSIQDDIALQITRALSVSVSPEGQARMRGQGTHNIEAYLAFLEGQDALSTYRTEEAGKASAHFNKALELDPKFARAMVMLARARLFDAEFSVGPNLRAQVEQSRSEAATLVERALALDPQLSDAYVERGDLLQFENPQAAEQDYRKAIELSPSNARAHQQLASLLWEDPKRRKEPELLEQLERARSLDPLESGLDVALAVYLFYETGNDEEAELVLRRVLERQPDYVPALQRHGEVLMFGMGRTVEAIRDFEKVLELDPGADTSRRSLTRAYIDIGDIEQARRVADDPQASLVCRLFIAHAERNVEEAGRLAYAAFREDLITGIDQQVAVEAINLEARRTRDYARAAMVLEEALNIFWISPTEPALGPNRGTPGDVVAYAGMLRSAGDESRAQALIKVVERTLEEDEAQRGGANVWNTAARVRLSAMKGNKEETLSVLEQTCPSTKSDCREFLLMDPLFAPLRNEPRFKVLVETLKRRQEEARRALRAR